MLVEAEMDRCGNITARPVNERWARRFARAVAKNGGPSFETQAKDGFTVFFQEGLGATEFMEDLRPDQRRDLEHGWPVRFLVDGWVVGNWYGYDAKDVA